MTRRFAPVPGAAGHADRPVLPNEIGVLDDGTAVARYDDMALLKYGSLDDLLACFGLRGDDLHEWP